jgi:hypothetical protein
MYLGEVEQEILRKYKPALMAIGVDFTHWEVIEAIEDCNQGLESRLQAVIAWYVWLERNHQRHPEEEYYLPNFTYILVTAIQGEWQPRGWKDKYLSLTCFQPKSVTMREKLQRIELFRYVAYEIGDDSEYVRFFQDGRMVWQLAVEDGLAMCAEELIFTFAHKTNSDSIIRDFL